MRDRKVIITKKVFLRFLLQFVAFLLFPIIFASNLYLTSAQQAKQSCIDSSLISLRYVRDELDNYVSALDQIATQLMFEPKLNKIATISKPEYGSRQVFYIHEFGESLKAKMSSSMQIDTNFILLLRDVSAAYYRENAVFNLEFFYNKFLNYENYTFEEWSNIVFQNNHPFFLPVSNILYEGVPISALTYVFPIVSGYTGKKAVLFLISNDKLEEFSRGSDSNPDRNLFISSSEGKILFSKISSDIEFDSFDLTSMLDGKHSEGFYFDAVENEKYMIVYTRSRFRDIIFTEVIPESVAMSKVNNIKKMTLYMVAAYFIIGIISAVSFAQRNSKPVNELVNKLMPFLQKLNNTAEDRHTDELEYIRTGVDYLKNTVQQTYDELKEIFLDRLFNGSFNDLEDMRQAGERLNLNMKGSYYCVAVMELFISNNEDENRKRDIAQSIYEQLVQNLPGHVFGTILKKYKISILFMLQANNKDSTGEVVNFLLKAKSEIQQSGEIDAAAAGVGRVVSTLTDIQFSYEQALFTLNNAAKENHQVMLYDDLPYSSLENIFYYPIEMEHKLFNSTKAGDLENVRLILDTIYEENIIKRKLTQRVGNLLMGNLQSTLLKICADRSITQEYSQKIKKLNINMPQPMVMDEIIKAFLEICEVYSCKKANQKANLSKKIISFVQENYNNPMMGVPMVAENFNFSESYFSQFFKECTGQNFSVYLEKYRIEKAKELICENKYDLERIAIMIGYNNSNTFRRAFKRLEGISPSDYKQNVFHKNLEHNAIGDI